MHSRTLDRVFSPRSVAVLGAGGPVGSRVLANVVAGGFQGPVWAVGGEAPAGARPAPSLAAVEGPLDLVVAGVPPDELPAVLRACAERAVGGVVVPPGAAGALDGPAARALVGEVTRRGSRVLGPNSIGLLRAEAALDATFTAARALRGSLALVSQSSALCAACLDWAAAHRLGFSTVVSVGDALDLDVGEVLEFLALDRSTKAILLYVESVRSARALVTGLRVAARFKPVIVVRAGRRGAGRDGAPRAADDAFDAALARTGAVRVPSIVRMFTAAALLGTPRAVNGNRLAIITNARGPALLAADRAADLGLVIPPLGEATRARLDAALPAAGSHTNPVDLLGDADPARYGAAVEACLADPEVDGVLAVLCPQALAQPLASAEAVIAASKGKAKPILACWMGEELVRGARARFAEAGVPDLPAPEPAVETFGVLASYARNQRLLRQVPGPLDPDALPHLERAQEIVRAAVAKGRVELTTAELQRLLAAAGVRDRATSGQRVRGIELHLSIARDPVFGPVIRFGRGAAGGGLVGDAVVALPPLDTSIIQTLIRTSRIAPLFTEAGGIPAAGVAAFERALWALSEIVSELPELRELELSPLLVAAGEVYAAGARAAVAPKPAGAGRYDHMAIHPPPHHLEERWQLPGGTHVWVRPIRPEDAELEATFVRNLSPDARHLRFMTALKELTRDMLIRFTQYDYDRELALVAVVEEGGRSTEIGVARYAMDAPDSAAVAIVIADEWQGKGIGKRLLSTLIAAARAKGLKRLGGEILVENEGVRALLTKLGFTFHRDPESSDILQIQLLL